MRRILHMDPIWFCSLIFVTSLTLYLVVGISLNERLRFTGDEPWYLMQGYALIHYHTPSLTQVLQEPTVKHQFDYDYPPDTHVRDYLGNGELLLPNLPGYSAIIGVSYLLAGRMGILVLQALLSASVCVLLFLEICRIYSSRSAAIFAVLAVVLALPALAFVGQVFPSAIASSLAFAGFLLATRLSSLTTAPRKFLAAAIGIGIVSALLPWLHFKYALISLALVGIALLSMYPSLTWKDGHKPSWRIWRSALIVTGVPFVSYLLIVIYCRRFFGTWTPQISTVGSALDLTHPDLGRLASLFSDMFLSQQSGLLPWVPLTILVAPGLILLWRRDSRYAQALALCCFGLLGGFLSALFTEVVYQGYALPASQSSVRHFLLLRRLGCIALACAHCLAGGAH